MIPLSEDLSKYSMPEKMKSMLSYFWEKCAVQMWSDEQYNSLERTSTVQVALDESRDDVVVVVKSPPDPTTGKPVAVPRSVTKIISYH